MESELNHLFGKMGKTLKIKGAEKLEGEGNTGIAPHSQSTESMGRCRERGVHYWLHSGMFSTWFWWCFSFGDLLHFAGGGGRRGVVAASVML